MCHVTRRDLLAAYSESGRCGVATMPGMPLSVAFLIFFGVLLMVYGIVGQMDLGPRAMLLAFGTICLVAAGGLQVMGRRR